MNFFILTKHKQSKGFTIIELLVVISIISLLSATVIAAMSTARMKARNSKVVQQVAQYQKAFAQYYNQHGYYPDSGAAIGTRVCLGNGYAYNGVSGTCAFLGSTNESPTLTTELNTFMPVQPPVNTTIVRFNGNDFEGAAYVCGAALGAGCGVNSGTQIQWVLEGNVPCGPSKNSPTISSEGNTLCFSDPAGQD